MDFHLFHLYLQILSHPCNHIQDQIKIMCIQCTGCIGAHMYILSCDIFFFSDGDFIKLAYANMRLGTLHKESNISR